MTFGIDLTNSGTGIGDKTYEDVLTGIAASGVLTATTGSSGGASWSLAHDGTNWDLTISGALDGSYGAGGGGLALPICSKYTDLYSKCQLRCCFSIRRLRHVDQLRQPEYL